MVALPAGQAAAAAGDVAGVRLTLEAITAALVAMQVQEMPHGGGLLLVISVAEQQDGWL